MASTRKNGVVVPDPGDTYQLQTDLVTMADSINPVVVVASQAAQDALPKAQGLTVWRTDVNQLQIWNSTSWSIYPESFDPRRNFRSWQLTQQGIPTGTYVQVPNWTAGLGDQSTSDITLTSNSGTVSKPGTYEVAAQITWSASATGSRAMDIRVNGVAVRRVSKPNEGAGGNPATALSAPLYLAAGDVVSIWAWQNSGAALNAGTGDPNLTWWTVARTA